MNTQNNGWVLVLLLVSAGLQIPTHFQTTIASKDVCHTPVCPPPVSLPKIVADPSGTYCYPVCPPPAPLESIKLAER